MTQQEENLSEMAALLGDHQVTDDQGNLTGEETSAPEPAAEETNTEEPATAQEPAAKPQKKESIPSTEGDETDLAVDDSGKKYVPEKRFKDVYAKWKEAERVAQQKTKPQQSGQQPQPQYVPTDKTAALETEILFSQFPQFDPSRTDEYSEVLDLMAADIYLASNGQLTKVQAARTALDRAKNLALKSERMKSEAKTVKVQQAESEFTGRGGNVGRSTTPDTDNMSDKELEAYLRSTGQW